MKCNDLHYSPCQAHSLLGITPSLLNNISIHVIVQSHSVLWNGIRSGCTQWQYNVAVMGSTRAKAVINQRPSQWLPTRFSEPPLLWDSAPPLHQWACTEYMSTGWCRSDGLIKGIWRGTLRETLCQTGVLRNMGDRRTALTWMKPFLSDHSQKVVVDVESSDSSPVTSGAPQGLVLRLILFLIS